MKKINYAELEFNKIYGKFKLTDKFFKDTHNYRYDKKAKEYQDLIKFDNLFAYTLSDYYKFFCSIRLLLPTDKKSKRYCFMIFFDIKTGLLSYINIYDLPQTKNKMYEERRKKIIKAVKDCIGYFIAIMIHHGYIEKIGD